MTITEKMAKLERSDNVIFTMILCSANLHYCQAVGMYGRESNP